jgi:NADH:ubiquinone oxidoreductase subunit K
MEDQTLHHFMQDLLPIVVMPIMVIAGAWVLGLIVAAFRNRARLRAQTEIHTKILDKFSSVEEFTAYLESEAGRSFFENSTNEPAAPLAKILGSIQKGVILTLLGLGFFIVSNVFGTQDSWSIFIIIATISIMIGLGFLISSFISYRLAKSWDLIPGSGGKFRRVADEPEIKNA